MARHSLATSLEVYRDTSDRFLAAAPGGAEAWKVVLEDEGSVATHGPRSLQLWFKWCPSDWERVKDPSSLPESVQAAIAALSPRS